MKTQRRKLGRILALVLAMLLVATAAVGCKKKEVFEEKPASDVIQPTATPAPTEAPVEEEEEVPEEEPEIEYDWYDMNGEGYFLKDSVTAVLMAGVDYVGPKNREKLFTEDELKQIDESKDVTANAAFIKGDEEGNDDSLGLLILDSETQEMTLLYIPQDTIANILLPDENGIYNQSITASVSDSYEVGATKELSCELACYAISNLMKGMPVDRYLFAEYIFDTCCAINEIEGGIEYTFQEDVTGCDPAFKKGATIKFTNEQLYKFMRYDYDNDLEATYRRGLRNVDVLKSMIKSWKVVFTEDFSKSIKVFNTLKDADCVTNVDLDEFTYLAKFFVETEDENMNMVLPEGELVQGETILEYHMDEEWLNQFIIDHFCEPKE